MSAIANITVFDGAASPVSHTLVPESVSREKNVVTAVWREKLASVPQEGQVTLTTKMELLKSGVYRTERRLVVPVMESISGQNAAGYTAAPKVAYENTSILVGLFSRRSDVTGRRLVRQMGVNLDNNVSTSVAAATAGPIPELFDLLVSPT